MTVASCTKLQSSKTAKWPQAGSFKLEATSPSAQLRNWLQLVT
jgi:hypothetical protein